MGKRIISSVILLILLIPIIKIGGNIFSYVIYIIGLLGTNEFLNIKNSKKTVPMIIKLLTFIAFTFLILSNIDAKTLTFTIDCRVLSGIFLLFTIPTLIYDREKYSINDALYMIGGIIFLGISFSLAITIRNISLKLLIYLLLISTMTDTYSYITGNLIGKKKLLEKISPCKTIEGMIGGILFGTFVPTMYYITTINQNINILTIIMITLFLSILGSIGDLFFSAVKRYFQKKDFSNVIPGHGGILDRFDSIIFIILGFTFFINIIGG